ncbi:hypothetical protein K6U52_12710 [Vibrio vulnificus]|uniref:hypothetical protein n=1 Tax=Vibrio vulnificus TaxID=672 RepID=UPI001EEB0AF2|nr:hypothetical protein [Vibrio vulnificus]MCG6314100.1 hypothetical protein [Vibrio vulnificus]
MLRISPLPLFIDSAAKQKKADFIEVGFLFTPLFIPFCSRLTFRYSVLKPSWA